jgi:hypothetical protein
MLRKRVARRTSFATYGQSELGEDDSPLGEVGRPRRRRDTPRPSYRGSSDGPTYFGPKVMPQSVALGLSRPVALLASLRSDISVCFARSFGEQTYDTFFLSLQKATLRKCLVATDLLCTST